MCTSRFAEAFRILEDSRPSLMLDPFLAHQLTKLQRDIRCRVLQQYTRPFHSVRLGDMADALGASVAALEAELADLIVDGTIRARIDSHNKVGTVQNQAITCKGHAYSCFVAEFKFGLS